MYSLAVYTRAEVMHSSINLCAIPYMAVMELKKDVPSRGPCTPL